MEHVTLYNLALAVAVLIFSKVKHHKTYATHWCFLAGAVIGAGIMFTNSAYGFISSGNDQFTYRSMAVGGTVQRYFDTIGGNIIRISNYLTECNALMNVLLAALFVLSIRGRQPLIRALPLLLCTLMTPAWFIVLRTHSIQHGWFTWRALGLTIFAGAAFLYYCCDIRAAGRRILLRG